MKCWFSEGNSLIYILAGIAGALAQGVLIPWGDIVLVLTCAACWRRHVGVAAVVGLISGLVLGTAQGNLGGFLAFHYVLIAWLAELLPHSTRKQRVYSIALISCLSLAGRWGVSWWFELSSLLSPQGLASLLASNCLLAFLLPEKSEI